MMMIVIQFVGNNKVELINICKQISVGYIILYSLYI